MRRHYISFNLVWIIVSLAGAVRKDDICEKCVKIEECPSFANLNKHEQQVWLEQVPCDGQQATETTIFGFSPVAKGDYVCCPKSNIWEKNNISSSVTESNNKTTIKPDEIRPNSNGRENLQQTHQSQYVYPGEDYNGPNYYDPNYQNYQNNYRNPQYNPYDQNNVYGQNGLNNQIYGQNPNYFQYPGGGNVWSNPRQPGVMPMYPGQTQNVWQNPNVYPQQQLPNPNYNYGNGNLFSGPNMIDQCAAQTSALPDPQTQCCGRDMSDAGTITDLQNLLNIYAPSYRQSWPLQNIPRQPSYQPWSLYPQKQKLSENNTVIDIGLDDRIAGGKETELDQFPWTVLLKMTFNHGNNVSIFNCGGSLISQRYVLTAGHCVFEPEAVLVGVNVTLAEYDKATFPRDCKYDIGRKPKCIDNVLMFAEDVILHQQYDDDQLHNDIALIRLQGYAPYTRFIRPICLPPIDIDSDDFSNLPLAVAGWGRNGKYLSDIKQSTVVHLVPHEQCQKSYQFLSQSHLCAAGKTGEDTCKGDSGGPLMMMFRGSYYLIGVVSGKRADSPCGSKVPSLYTNVYQYVPWIRNNILRG